MSLPNLKLAHMGFAVKNLRVMEEFYTEELGFKVSDRGIVRGAPIVFLTRDPADHHQIVIQEQRKPDEETMDTSCTAVRSSVNSFRTSRVSYITSGGEYWRVARSVKRM